MRPLRRLQLIALLILLPFVLVAQGSSSDLRQDLARLRQGEGITGLPPADSVTQGARRISAGTTVNGTIVARGPVDVYGKVNGSVVSLLGDVVMHPGGSVTG